MITIIIEVIILFVIWLIYTKIFDNNEFWYIINIFIFLRVHILGKFFINYFL
jgi:hypothetical protein